MLQPADATGGAQRPTERNEGHAVRHAARVSGGIRRASLCGSTGAEQAAVQDAAGRDSVARKAAYVLHRRGKM